MLGIGYLGYPIHQIGGNPTEDWEDLLGRPPTPLESKTLKLRLDCEKTLPVDYIYVFKHMQPAFKSLEKNEILAVAIDGGKDRKRVFVRLFNRTTFFPSGPMKLALKTKATVLPLFVIREWNYRHKVIIEAPLKLDTTGHMENDIKKNTQKFISILGDYIIRYPCHYVQPLVGELKPRFVSRDTP